jgi:peptidoglycan/LPS O-acetylase OafA/YrhL
LTKELSQYSIAHVRKPTRIPELDGLRGLAILLVIVFHYTNGEALTRSSGLAYYVQRGAAPWTTGVDLFFVLSGFLIGGILIEARGSDSYFRTFYVRRFFRIIPIYYLWICLYIALASIAGRAIRVRSFSNKVLPDGFEVYAHFLFIQNLVPFNWSVQSGLWGSWFGHLWSLAVEEQFYLLAPLMIAWLSPRRLRAVLVGIVCGAPLVRIVLLHYVHQIDCTRVMPSRADALAVGILVSILWKNSVSRLWLQKNIHFIYWTMAGLFFAGFGPMYSASGSESPSVFSFGLTWITIFYALLVVIVLAESEGWIAWAMRIGWLRAVGRVSYCMYIVHWIMDLLFHSVLLHARPQIVTLSGAGISLLAAIATYAAAWVSWEILEGPLVSIGHAFRYSTPAAGQATTLISEKPGPNLQSF